MDVSGDYSFLFLAYSFKAIYQQKLFDRLTNQLLEVKIDVCNTRNDRLQDIDILEKVEWYQLKIK